MLDRKLVRLMLLPLVVLLYAVPLRAESPTSSPLLKGLYLSLQDPQHKVGMTTDKTLVLSSKFCDVTFGKDGMARMHKPGTVERMAKLSEGFRVNLGEVLGHKENKGGASIGDLSRIFQDQRMDYRLQPNPIGFGAKLFTPENRPMEITAHDGSRLMVKPDGQCSLQLPSKGRFGFNTGAPQPQLVSGKQDYSAPKAMYKTQITQTNAVAQQRTIGRPQLIGRPQILGRNANQPTAISTFRPMAISSFKPMAMAKGGSGIAHK